MQIQMKKILIAYASKYGSTKEVAEKVSGRLSAIGWQPTLEELKNVKSISGYDALILGAALYMYKWHKDAMNFIKKFQKELEELPVAVFALGPVKDPIDKEEWKNSRDQLDKALAQYNWFKPIDTKLFGGKFDPNALGSFMKFFAGKEPQSDIRDWKEIEKWSREIGKRLG